jgi:hypothetical protein
MAIGGAGKGGIWDDDHSGKDSHIIRVYRTLLK